MKILGLISSPNDPASRLRIMQYESWFKRKGELLTSKFFTPLRDEDPAPWSVAIKKITGINEWRSSNFAKTIGRSSVLFSQTGYDIIWQNRLLQLHSIFWEKKLKKPVAFDFDDAIWLSEGESQVIKKIQLSSIVFAGNSYLAEYAAKHNHNVHIVPTTIDTEKLFPLNTNQENFIIGWIGTASNFIYLETIWQPLLDLLKIYKDARLAIVSTRLPEFLDIGHPQIIFKPWNESSENQLINDFSVGIMPLNDTEWTRGKCSFKVLQYLACGKPAIVSPIGMNKQLLLESKGVMAATTANDWLQALTVIKNDRARATEIGSSGRTLIEDNYSCKKWTDIILQHMKTMIS